ncbi:little elongation complex subunit 1 isoform X2 [Malaclemys terrapin pileata]|uniref:little elongation complex subunit 1 isoform X2 n=1 Tax=Malaclemys terrapin pileata TaxID=2991368 RepID=UPI0023A833F7|nr:little elongation complex subunit 1 isoform X2 [Malaclemys terrapin pileata]
MMPGEAPAAGIAAEAATACANCSALQQNLNEYVAALIALKQKIIDTDCLLTEYQQKCNELQLAERENNTLRHQVEQMLQKISPLEKCQQELGSLKAELEEKKSSLKIYQQTHLEYARVKEEIARSDSVKKKLEAKVKKLEEAAAKHMQDFRQLKTEKKVLEKELKKAQEKHDDFPKEKCKKVLKHAETQSAREDPVANIDKGKIKLLLEELWMCIDSTTGKTQNQEHDYILASVQGHSRMPVKTSKLFTEEVAQTHRKFRKSDVKTLHPHCSPETIENQSSLTALQIKVDKEPPGGDQFESKTTEEGLQDCNGDSAFYEDKTIEVVVQTDLTDSSSETSDQEQEQLGGNLLDILNWARPLPPLLSPVCFSPLATQDTLFGESTDSSDEEIDHNAHIVESILEEGKAESQSNTSFISMKESNEDEKSHEPHDREISTKLRENEEMPIYIDTFTAKLRYIKEQDAEAKRTEMTVSSMNTLANEEHLEEDSDNIGPTETDLTLKVATPKLEAINEKEVHTDEIQIKDQPSSAVSSNFQYLQEKSNELIQTEKTIVINVNTTANSEHMKERYSELMEAKEAELPGKVETPKPASTLRGDVRLQTGEPIFGTESVLVTPENFEDEPSEAMGNEEMENESSDIQTKSNVINTTPSIEEHIVTTEERIIATITTKGFCVETSNEPNHNEEADVRFSFRNSKSFSGAEHDNELMCQCNGERTLLQTEIDTEAKDISTKSQCAEEKISNEEILDKQFEHIKQHEVNEEAGLENNNAFRHDSFILATERSRDSLYMDGENHIAEVCRTARSMSDGDGEQLRTGEQCVEVNITQPEQNIFIGSSVNKEDFLETYKFSKSLHVMEVGELQVAEEERCLQAKLDHEQKDANNLLQKKLDFETTVMSQNPASGINGENDPLEPEQIVRTNHVLLAPECVTERASEVRQAKNTYIASEQRSSKFQNFIKVFQPQEIEMEMEHSELRERSSVPLETEKIDTVKSVIKESEHSSWAQFVKPLDSCSVTENSQCEEIKEKLNDKPCESVLIQNCNSSPGLEENGVEEVETRNQISDVSDQVVSEKDSIGKPALPIEDVLQTGSIDTKKINSPVTATIGLESTAVFVDFTAFNFQVCGEPFKQNCQAFDTNSEEESVTALSTASSLTRRNEKYNDHVIQSMPNYSVGNLVKGKTIQNDKEKIKPLDCPSNKYDNKNRAEIENEKEQPNAIEPQKTLIDIQIFGTSSVDSGKHVEKEASLVFEEAECETCSSKEISTALSVIKETSPQRVEPLCSSEGQVRPIEYRLDETMKNNDQELNIIKISGETNGNKSSKSTSDAPKETDDSEEEDFPFRKVKYTKEHERFLVSNEKLRTFWTYTVDVPEITTAVDENDKMCERSPSVYSDALTDMAMPCITHHYPSIVKEQSCLTEKVYPKGKLFSAHGIVFHNNENNERASECRENSKTSGSASDNETSLIRLEESFTSAEVSEKIPTKQTTSEINLSYHMLAKCSETYKHVIKNSKLDTSLSGNFLQINGNEKLASNMEQSVSCDAGIEGSKAHTVFCEELNDKQKETCVAFASADINTNIVQEGCQSCFDDRYSDVFPNETHFQRKGRKFLTEFYQHPTVSDEISDPRPVNETSKSQKAIFENTHIVDSESSLDLLSKTNSRSRWKVQEPSDVLNVSAKTSIQADQGRLTQRLPQGKGKTRTLQVQLTQPVLANADTSTPTKRSPETINKIRQEIGPPLPPLLPPLIATPPRTVRPVSPIMSSSSRSSLPSPLDGLISPLRVTPVPPLMSPLSDAPKYKSPPIFSTPSPSETTVGRRILSSPLQFCAATPKHALPVPGRLPPSAAGSSALDVPQENSVKILDTMYPELSPRARTLNILKGNIQPNRRASSEYKNVPGPVSQFSGFKAISSTSTAFVKTGSNSESHSNKDKKDSGSQSHVGKRILSASMPRSAKRLRLDSELPQLETKEDVAIKAIGDLNIEVLSAAGKTVSLNNCEIRQLAANCNSELPSPVENIIDPVTLALKKIAESCFDLLPVIRSHVYVGNILKVPVMRDEEKEVVYEFGIANKHLAEPLLHAILNKLKTQKMSLNHNFTQALCRVYIGICRQLGDLERARLFCYSLLKEDFPESAKLTLFITNVWDDIFSFQGVINKAMQLVVRKRARGEVLSCLCHYLSWEKSPPLDTGIVVSSLLLAIQLCPKMEFQLSERYGEDLSDSTWECILAIDLLCCHLKWSWTHDNIISKELWPVMDQWVKHRKGHETVPPIPDIIVASTLRLIGRLGQIGLKEGFFPAVKNITSIIGRFIQHAKEEDVPWGVQLAAVYALCDLGPSNPLEVVEAIQSWRTATSKSIPSAVTSGISEVSSLCTVELH